MKKPRKPANDLRSDLNERQSAPAGPARLSPSNSGGPAFTFIGESTPPTSPTPCPGNLRARFNAYLDCSLSDEQCDRIDHHLLTCFGCASAFEAFMEELEDSLPSEDGGEAASEDDFERESITVSDPTIHN